MSLRKTLLALLLLLAPSLALAAPAQPAPDDSSARVMPISTHDGSSQSVQLRLREGLKCGKPVQCQCDDRPAEIPGGARGGKQALQPERLETREGMKNHHGQIPFN